MENYYKLEFDKGEGDISETKGGPRNQYNDLEIDHLTDSLYQALTGEEPSKEVSERLEYGGEVLKYLFTIDKKAGYVALASLLQEAGNKLPEEAYGKATLYNLADYFDKASYKIK